jgi:IMP cyclohydrolase
MYVGRIVSIGLTPEGRPVVMYRVSSRSFPNRKARKGEDSVSIVPRDGYEADLARSPYIAYNCLRLVRSFAVASNGSHTDPIAEKIESGMNVRDALTLSLLAMDYERDSFKTPRIAAVVSTDSQTTGFLGIVRHDAILVREIRMTPGHAWFVTTYERNTLNPSDFDPQFRPKNVEESVHYVVSGGVFAEFEKPITAAAALGHGNRFELATLTV